MGKFARGIAGAKQKRMHEGDILDIYTYDSRYGVILRQVSDVTQIGCFDISPHVR